MYKINQFSKISGLTVKALRYYDQEGILQPAFRNMPYFSIIIPVYNRPDEVNDLLESYKWPIRHDPSLLLQLQQPD